MATIFVKLFGKSTLGLAYGLSVAEALIAPAMPSTTARAGGIFMPIISSLSISAGSKPSEFSLACHVSGPGRCRVAAARREPWWETLCYTGVAWVLWATASLPGA